MIFLSSFRYNTEKLAEFILIYLFTMLFRKRLVLVGDRIPL